MQKEKAYPYQNLSLLNMDDEIWKPVVGYEEYYMVSNKGRVKWLPRWVYYHNGRKRFVDEKIQTQYISCIGQHQLKSLSVNFIVEKKRSKMIVARLVYATFIKPLKPISQERIYILHFNDILLNYVENLYSVTAKQLADYNIKMGYNKVIINTPKIRKLVTKSKSIPVTQYSLKGEPIATYYSIREASRKTGIDSKSISKVMNGEAKHAGKHLWKAN